MAYLNGNKSIRQAIVLEIFIQNTKIVSAESQHTLHRTWLYVASANAEVPLNKQLCYQATRFNMHY